MQSSRRQQSLESIAGQYDRLHKQTIEKLAAFNLSGKVKPEDIKRLQWIDTEKQKAATIDDLQRVHPRSYKKTSLLGLRRSKTPAFTEYLRAMNVIKNKLCNKYPFIPYPLAYYVIVAINMRDSDDIYSEATRNVYNMDDILLKSAQLMDTVLTTQQKQQIDRSMAPSGNNTLLKVIRSFNKIYSDNKKVAQLKENLPKVMQTTSYGYQMQVSFIKLLFDYYAQMSSLFWGKNDQTEESLLRGKYDESQIIQYLQILLMAYSKSTAEP